MPTINPADREAVAREFIASHAAPPAPTDSPAAARFTDAMTRMTAEERGEAFQQFLATIAGLPGGFLLLEYTRSIH